VLADAGLATMASTLSLPTEIRVSCDQHNSIAIVADDYWRVGVPNEPTAENSWAFRCSYPTPFEIALRSICAQWGVPASFVWSVYRQESSFRTHIISPAGAVGVAQMIPQTAKSEAAALGLDLDADNADEMEQLRFQLPLSVHHLSSLIAKVPKAPGAQNAEGACGVYCLALVAAAYNAGWPAVQNWLHDAKDLSPELFLERIPYGETRMYVHRVMTSYLHYQALVASAQFPVF
jgi:soluble lytic murein transglycosylase-like protein